MFAPRKHPPPETLRPHRANRPHRAKSRAVSVRMTPPPPHNCVFGGTPLKTKNAAPLAPDTALSKKKATAGRVPTVARPPGFDAPRAETFPADEIRYPRNAKSQVLSRQKTKMRKAERRDVGPVAEDSAPVTSALTPTSMTSHPYSQYTPGSEKKQG